MLRKSWRALRVLVLSLGLVATSIAFLPELSTTASAHAQSDPQVVAVIDTASIPGSSCTIVLIANPGTAEQYTKYRHACGPGAVIFTRLLPMSDARAMHLPYLTIPASEGSVENLIAHTRVAILSSARTAQPLIQCGGTCQTNCGQTIKAEIYWEASLPDPPGDTRMYSFVDYGRDIGPPADCYDWLNFGQTGIQNTDNLNPPGWLYNAYAGHVDQLQCRLLPYQYTETFTDLFSKPPNYYFVWTVDDKPGNYGCPWGYTDFSWSIGPLN